MTGDKQTKRSAFSVQRLGFCSKGFTLVEMLVAVSLFSIVVAATADLYLAISRAQKSVRARQRLGSEARFAAELISREIRAGTIDYAAYGGSAPKSANFLYLRDRDGNAETFRVSGGPAQCVEASHPCLVVCDSLGNCSPLSTKNIFWDKIDFRVSPERDPFLFDPVTGAYAADEQPHVTIAAKLRAESNLPEERAEIDGQITVVSRVYKR
ncbi:type II secretion system protein [Candidatus Uhrbacteria bacterium]|nr:type II secretion system protein [Candidatus Uhrbacteria bacterium]